MKSQKIFLTIAIALANLFAFSQIKVLSTGNIQMGGTSAHTGAKLNLYSYDNTSFRSDVFHTFGWGDAIKSIVNRNDGIAFSAWLNGNRTFMVFGNGDVWSSTGIYSSDSTLKKNIKNIENPLEIISHLRGVTYFKKDDKQEKPHGGLLAQEVEKILPDLVYETDKGIKGIAYIELIPYLIEAINEQQETIIALQEKIKNIETDCCNKSNNSKSVAFIRNNSSIYNNEEIVLYQNSPNPFNRETSIRFEIPKTVSKAQLHIFNMIGSLLKTVEINVQKEGSVKVNASEFSPGTYLYSLVVDGKIVDTKQMLLTK